MKSEAKKIQNNRQDCTVLVCSCDAYEDLWTPFFTLLSIQWKDRTFPVALNTESKSYESEAIPVRAVNQKDPAAVIPWGQRMIECLEQIETEYTLLMLDDFFLCRPVDNKKIEDCLLRMKNDGNIATFCFYAIPDKKNERSSFDGFVKRPKKGEYKYSCQAGLWRTKQLASFIRQHESPWVWEVVGNRRSFRDDFDFYCANNTNSLALDYYGDGQWSGVMRGKWYLPYVEPLFEKYRIAVDFSTRGTIGKEEVEKIIEQKDKPLLHAMRKCYGDTAAILKNLKSLR